jgi:hypothetical protein
MNKRSHRKARPTRRHAGAKPAASPFDPEEILRAIATDPNAPTYARVQACKALMKDNGRADDAADLDSLNARAVELMRRTRDEY